MQNTDLISSIDVKSKPVIVNIPGTASYAVVTTNSNHQPVYHIVDMSLAGYGPLAGTGAVTAHDLPLAPSSLITKHGYHFTGLEDHMANYSIVYASRFTPDVNTPSMGTTDIIAYNFGAGITTPTASIVYSIYGCGSTEQGELQISPDGGKLGWWQYGKQLGGFDYRNGNIYTIPLAGSKTAIGTGAVNIMTLSAAGSIGNGMLDFMKNSSNILYSQRGVYQENTGAAKYNRNVWNYDPVNLSSLSINPAASPLTSYLFGEIKRGIDGNYYIPQMGRPLDQIHSYTGSAFNPNLPAPADTMFKLASSLPTQVYKIYPDATQTLSDFVRSIGNKEYELKDHLGNVCLVLSDQKFITSIGTSSNVIDAGDSFYPEIKNYTDYYAFGMSMPGRMFNPGTYRYGFNGKENDNEVKGVGNVTTAEFWEYDARLGRRWNRDPVDKPWISPYHSFSNKPILNIDPNGSSDGDY